MSGNGQNPWLKDYDVGSPPGSTGATPPNARGSSGGGGGAPGGGTRVRLVTRPAGSKWRKWIYGLIGGVIGAAAVTMAQKGTDPIIKWFDNKINDEPVVKEPTPSPPNGLNLFSLRVQVRLNLKEGREYVRKHHPSLEMAFDHVNSSHGLYIHPGIKRQLPSFILEPRPGHEAEFRDLAFHGMGDITLHAFAYESEDQLYRVAGKCGLNTSEGNKWIKTWSTWREGAESVESNKCVEGGVCVVLSRGCETDTFEESK